MALPLFSNGQSYVAHYIEPNHIKQDTLIDKVTLVKFILDKDMIIITAIDNNGKLLWKTDPAIDNKLGFYRVKRPIIIYFSFGIDRRTKTNQVIYITYNNSQFGEINEKSGRFTYEGQD